MTQRLVRARHGAAAVPGATTPWDRIHYRIHHPALFSDRAEERQTGQLPPDLELAPWPVVIILNGINVGPDGYRWVATLLAAHGIAAVTFTHVGEVTPGEIGLSPGLDLSALTPGEFRSRPSATAVGPLLDALAAEHRSGPLAGLLDLDRVVLGGHSAGGTVALLNADRRWFPSVVATFAYAGHTMPATLLGHPEGTVLPIGDDMPALVAGGTADGVVAASAVRYGAEGSDRHDPLAATFEHGATAPRSVFALIDGAGHLLFCDPVDPTTARGFLEPEPGPGTAARRDLLGRLVVSFCAEQLGIKAPETLSTLANDPLIAGFRVR